MGGSVPSGGPSRLMMCRRLEWEGAVLFLCVRAVMWVWSSVLVKCAARGCSLLRCTRAKHRAVVTSEGAVGAW